ALRVPASAARVALLSELGSFALLLDELVTLGALEDPFDLGQLMAEGDDEYVRFAARSLVFRLRQMQQQRAVGIGAFAEEVEEMVGGAGGKCCHLLDPLVDLPEQ